MENKEESRKGAKVTSGSASMNPQLVHRLIEKPEGKSNPNSIQHQDQGRRNGSNIRSIDQVTAGYSNVSRVENLAIGIQDQDSPGNGKLQRFGSSVNYGDSPKADGKHGEIPEQELAK